MARIRSRRCYFCGTFYSSRAASIPAQVNPGEFDSGALYATKAEIADFIHLPLEVYFSAQEKKFGWILDF